MYTIVDVEEEKGVCNEIFILLLHAIDNTGTLHALGWTDDGQLLTVSTLSGR